MSAPFWVVPIGLVLCRIGFAWQLRRDWQRHGLSYVAWPTLALLILGSALLGWWAVSRHYPLTAAACVVPVTVDLWVWWLKGKDWTRNRLRLRR